MVCWKWYGGADGFRPKQGFSSMTPKQAITLAKSWVEDIVAEEGVAQIDLEEIRYDEPRGQWLITVGFYRAPPKGSNAGLGALLVGNSRKSFKLVRIDDKSETVLSMEHRAVEGANG